MGDLPDPGTSACQYLAFSLVTAIVSNCMPVADGWTPWLCANPLKALRLLSLSDQAPVLFSELRLYASYTRQFRNKPSATTRRISFCRSRTSSPHATNALARVTQLRGVPISCISPRRQLRTRSVTSDARQLKWVSCASSGFRGALQLLTEVSRRHKAAHCW